LNSLHWNDSIQMVQSSCKSGSVEVIFLCPMSLFRFCATLTDASLILSSKKRCTKESKFRLNTMCASSELELEWKVGVVSSIV